MRNLEIILKTSAVLWWIWGIFHFLIGIASYYYVKVGHPVGDFAEIPYMLNVNMGMEYPFPPLATILQHSLNLAWIGLVVTIAGFYIWKKNKHGIFWAAVVGGFADLSFFICVDLPGLAVTPAPQMTWISASAIILSLYVYFKSDGLKLFNLDAKSNII